jgi:hypothetical protein
MRGLLFILLLISTIASAQQEEIFNWPTFPGGEKELNLFLAKHAVYPLLAMQNAIEGEVLLLAQVDSAGKINSAALFKKAGWGLDDEAIRLIKMLPSWRPAQVNTINTSVLCLIPVNFAGDVSGNPVVTMKQYACFKKEELGYLKSVKKNFKQKIRFKEIE